MSESISKTSPGVKARAAGFFWLGTIVIGSLALFLGGDAGLAANLVAGACYVGAALFIYALMKPVNWSVSLVAAVCGILGCAVGAMIDLLHINGPVADNISFIFFGLHCFLVGVLIVRSTFLPKVVGALMVTAGLGWLTMSISNILFPPFGRMLLPAIMVPGFIGETSLTFWLIVKGVNVGRWNAQAGLATE